MKRITSSIILISLLFVTSCSKYEDGPLISFRSKDKRLEGEWLLKYFTVDGDDSLSLLNDYFGSECKFTFYPYQDGIHPLSIEWGNASGNYCFANGSDLGISDAFLGAVSVDVDTIKTTNFPFTFLNNSHPRSSLNEWPITRLKYKEVWFEINSDDKVYELHLENIKKF